MVISPKFVKQIKRAAAIKETKYGKMSVVYEAKKAFQMQIVIPHGLTCLVVLEQDLTNVLTVNGEECKAAVFQDGKYLFTLKGGKYLIG